MFTEVYPLIFVLLASVGQNQPGGLCPASCAEISQFNVAHLGSNLQYRAWLSHHLYLHSQKSRVTGYVRNIGDRVHPLITVLDRARSTYLDSRSRCTFFAGSFEHIFMTRLAFEVVNT